MRLSPFATGTLMTGLGVIILSPDAALIRLIGADPFQFSFWRGLSLTLVMLSAVLLAYGRTSLSQLSGIFTLVGLGVALLFSTTTIGFVLGSQQGDPAFTVVAVAATPLSAALWSWFLYQEPADRPTMLAMAIGFLAVCLGAYEVLDTARGTILGFFGAIYIPIAMGLGFTLTRYLPDQQSPWAVYVFAGIFTCILGILVGGKPTLPNAPLHLVLTSVLIVSAFSFVLISVGPRYISAAQTSLMLLLETALSPVFVFWLLKEAPGPLTMASGIILIITLIGQTFAQLHLARTRIKPSHD